MPSELKAIDSLGTYEDYIIDLASRLTEIRNIARNNQEKAKEISKTYHHRKTLPIPFHVGQLVFIQKYIKKGKFDDNYIGPYPITAIFPDKQNIEIQKTANTKRIIHCNQAKIAHVADSSSSSESDYSL
ncbi:hypothetical protein PV325_005226 [Microctonus aethiopoides]|nr:hypothetical protein PV325_005226 [Microctonus aethiopoides]